MSPAFQVTQRAAQSTRTTSDDVSPTVTGALFLSEEVAAGSSSLFAAGSTRSPRGRSTTTPQNLGYIFHDPAFSFELFLQLLTALFFPDFDLHFQVFDIGFCSLLNLLELRLIEWHTSSVYETVLIFTKKKNQFYF